MPARRTSAEPCGSTRVLAGVGTIDDMIWGEDVYARLALDNVRTLTSGIVVLTYRVGA